MTAITVLSTEIRQLDGLYSLNDLHKAAGGEAKHQPALFLRNDQTKALVEEIHSTNLQTAAKTINGGPNRGTYVCRELVYAYAMWISPKFHLAVIRAFDAMATQARPAQAEVRGTGPISRLDLDEAERLQRMDPAGGLFRVYLVEQGVTEDYLKTQLERAPVFEAQPARSARPRGRSSQFSPAESPASDQLRLGRRLEICLERLGWTTGILVRRVGGIREQAINLTITRNSETSKHALKLADALGVSVHWLLEGPGEEPEWLPGRGPQGLGSATAGAAPFKWLAEALPREADRDSAQCRW